LGIRLLVVDDNPHVSWDGWVHPVNATFQHFVAALLDLPGSPVASITSCVPLRAATAAPLTRPLDPRIAVVGSTPFDGIEGYLHHLPAMLRANRPILRRTIGQADLVWLKVPASNAGLAAVLAARAGVPRFAWVAGSAAEVGAARFHGMAALAARATGAGYDLVGRLAGAGGHRLIVGEGIVGGIGIVASLVEPGELRDPDLRSWPPEEGPARLAWAGRLVEGKGLESLLAALAAEPGLTLDLVGDGPARDRLRSVADASGAGRRVTWAGHIADRGAYLDRLAGADAFAFPSPAEGFPKVVLDAFAVGLPLVATRSGALAELDAAGLIEPIAGPDADAITAAWRRLRDTEPAALAERRRLGRDFAARHTRPIEAAHLVDRWRSWWPEMPWDR
jgi:glycosyltransferase involved in cell wall biosynthesis